MCDRPAAFVEADEETETENQGKKKNQRAHVEIQRVLLYLRTVVDFFFLSCSAAAAGFIV